MQIKPLVGVTADRIMNGAHPSHIAGEKYIAAVVDGADAVALLVPALGERQHASDLLAAVDGLLFTGSYSNVEPHHYGGTPSVPGTLHDAGRDATTLPLIAAAIEAGVPVLAICRGFQELNVALGGTLHQHVHEVEGLADHREDKTDALDVQYGVSHTVRLVTDGMLQQLIAAAGIADTEVAHVNSLHGQGIARLAARLSAEAIAPDGLIEAVSVKDARAFALGVQWHPEWKHADDPLSTAIFRAFGAACRERLRNRMGSLAGGTAATQG